MVQLRCRELKILETLGDNVFTAESTQTYIISLFNNTLNN